jgi:predicted N-acetyltransferase YhbS
MRAMVDIRIVQGDALARVADFYKLVGYGGAVSEADITLAADANGCMAGAVRLCDEDGVIVLRGMQVDPAFQRQGIGRSLLMHCMSYLEGRTAYCLPYAHLAAFYGAGGFEPVPPDTLPGFLAARLAGYLAAGQQVLAMRRAGSPG